MDDYQTFIAQSRYARWIERAERRETWNETVTRYLNFWGDKISPEIRSELFKAIQGLGVMPSMRALASAGPALERDNIAGFNCAYLPVDSLRSFDEAFYILMCGTGVGFSVERQEINKLPEVPPTFKHMVDIGPIVVEDSKQGWAFALKLLLSDLFAGDIPTWDVSLVRPAGARLKTFGGRASGPAPLVELFKFVIDKVTKAAGRKLNALECHDIMCKIGEVVVVGGVRRSAMISLSNLSDIRMRDAKAGNWWETDAQRALSNNSVCYTEKPDIGVFMDEWHSLYRSKSGERGIFNRQASKAQAARNGRRDINHEFGTNPCSEIILRPYQFCNLSEVVIRADDDFASVAQKVRYATILGTLQSTLTDFKYLRPIWAHNTAEEALLGVSLTGILDNINLVLQPGALQKWKQIAIDTNAFWADKLGVNRSTAITCVKPSGTVSQLVDAASGIHPRWSDYYVRTVRADTKDPMTQFMKDQGVPFERDMFKPDQTTVFSFPIKSPKGSITRDELTALDHLELWRIIQDNWCEHKPSITVNLRDHEWMEAGAWVYENFDKISGIAFLPYSDHSYQQAPYQECSEDVYNALKEKSPARIKWEDFKETGDNTAASQTMACTGDVCEIVDIT